MKHFHRTHVAPAAAIAAADRFFVALGMAQTSGGARTRSFAGPLGTLTLSAKPEAGHYTFVEVSTDQMGESRLDRNVKRFFVGLHRSSDPSHTLEAAY